VRPPTEVAAVTQALGLESPSGGIVRAEHRAREFLAFRRTPLLALRPLRWIQIAWQSILLATQPSSDPGTVSGHLRWRP